MREIDWGSVIVYIIIVLGILHIYLKRTGQTLPELIQKIKEFFQSLGGESE